MPMDVKNEFVNAALEEEIYISQALGFVTEGKEGHM